MRVNITLKTRNGEAFAEAVYDEKSVVVKKGGKVSRTFSEHIRGGKIANTFRNNKEYVSEDGTILKDCIFKSASTAAQFVTGRSTNGLTAWKVGPKINLRKYLEENGLR